MNYIDVPKTTKYRLFRRGNIKRKQLVDDVVDINWSSDKEIKKQYPKVNCDLMIQIQD